MSKRIFESKGETILEAVIAMGILAVGLSLASTLMGSSLRNINASKNRAIAVGIAREGLEAMRNIRDTNWLKFNSKKRECWNHDPASESCGGTGESIRPGDYIVYKQEIEGGWKWGLENLRFNERPAPPTDVDPPVYFNTTEQKAYGWDGAKWVELTQLSLVDVDEEVDSNQNQDYVDDEDAYNHAYAWDEDPGVKPLGGGHARPTAFRRWLTISYLDNDGNEVTDPPGLNDTLNRMQVRSTVAWREGKYEFKTDLVTRLTDYMGRENLNN